MRYLVLVVAILTLVGIARADDEARSEPRQPMYMVWQCNDVRVTISEGPEGVLYDLGGSIWGGSQFFFRVRGYFPELLFNGRPCLQLR